jgi:hypothetical protein
VSVADWFYVVSIDGFWSGERFVEDPDQAQPFMTEEEAILVADSLPAKCWLDCWSPSLGVAGVEL